MRGTVALPPPYGATDAQVTLRLNGAMPNLQAFLDDPVHAAELTGTIEVEGMTGRPATVEGGTLHLLANVDGGPNSTMDYLVPFTASDGTRWLLQGSKSVKRAWGNDPWRATTVLRVAITTPEDRYEGTVPPARVTISLREALRLVTSIRATGTTGIAPAARTVLRFGTFFLRQVARTYLTPGR
jgi:cholesterol oxidase